MVGPSRTSNRIRQSRRVCPPAHRQESQYLRLIANSPCAVTSGLSEIYTIRAAKTARTVRGGSPALHSRGAAAPVTRGCRYFEGVAGGGGRSEPHLGGAGTAYGAVTGTFHSDTRSLGCADSIREGRRPTTR